MRKEAKKLVAKESSALAPIFNGAKKLRKKPLRGLTLIELLLATSLFAVTGTILYSVLSQGIRLWKRSEKERDPSREERTILAKMATDIRTASIHQWVHFLGEADQIYFCGLRRIKEDPPTTGPRLAKVHYYFLDKDEGAKKRGLYLAEYPIEQNFLEPPPAGKLLTNIFKEFHFEYGYWDPVEEKITTKEKWTDSKKIPRTIILKGKTDSNVQKTIVHPMGELIEYKEEKQESEKENEWPQDLNQ